MMKIHTYYVSVPELNAFDELKMLTQWRLRWFDKGFEPIVLGEWHAKQHPYFAEYDQAISALPSCNPSAYERACFLRWLALATAGGGLMSDYDVFPYGEDPGKVIWETVKDLLETKLLVMFQERAPSLVYTSPKTALFLCQAIASGKFGNRPQEDKPHFSDQYAIEDLVTQKSDWIELHDDVKGYMDEGWETAPFVHYSTASMARRNKLPRWRFIPSLRSK